MRTSKSRRTKGRWLLTLEIVSPKRAPGGCQCIPVPNEDHAEEYCFCITPAWRRNWARMMAAEGSGAVSAITDAQVLLRIVDAIKAAVGHPVIGSVSAARAEELTVVTRRPFPGAVSQPMKSERAFTKRRVA